MSFTLSTDKFSRRRFITASAQFAAGMIIAAPIDSLASQSKYHPLSFYHTHTGETLDINFNLRTRGFDNTKTLYHFLRDFRTGEVHPIDTRLLDMLCRLQRQTGSSGTFEVISGYRSPATNTKLRKVSSGVAKKSLHMDGRAIDIRLTDVPTGKLRTVACSMQRGGVGYYPRSNFIHLDTGRVRSW